MNEVLILKQKKYADIIFQINPSNKDILKKKYKKKWLDTKIKLILRKKINKPLFKEVISKIFKNFKYKEKKNYLVIELNSKDFLVENFKEVLKKISANSNEILAISPDYMDKECGILQFIILFFIFDRINEERKNTKLFF